MKAAAKFWAVFDKTLTAFMILAAVVVIFDTFAISIDVILRYTIGVDWTALFEISEYSLLWLTFLSAAWISRIDGHIKVDLLLTRMSPRHKGITVTITSIICAILYGYITYYALKLTVHDFQTGFYYPSVLEPPKWPIEMIVPIGCALLVVQFLRAAYGQAVSLKAASAEQ